MLLKVRAHPDSSRVEFAFRGGILHAWLTEPAERGRANRQLLRELGKLVGPCRLVRGAASTTKFLAMPLPLKRLEELFDQKGP